MELLAALLLGVILELAIKDICKQLKRIADALEKKC